MSDFGGSTQTKMTVNFGGSDDREVVVVSAAKYIGGRCKSTATGFEYDSIGRVLGSEGMHVLRPVGHKGTPIAMGGLYLDFGLRSGVRS